jgi:hypothetical protein
VTKFREHDFNILSYDIVKRCSSSAPAARGINPAEISTERRLTYRRRFYELHGIVSRLFW